MLHEKLYAKNFFFEKPTETVRERNLAFFDICAINNCVRLIAINRPMHKAIPLRSQVRKAHLTNMVFISNSTRIMKHWVKYKQVNYNCSCEINFMITLRYTWQIKWIEHQNDWRMLRKLNCKLILHMRSCRFRKSVFEKKTPDYLCQLHLSTYRFDRFLSYWNCPFQQQTAFKQTIKSFWFKSLCCYASLWIALHMCERMNLEYIVYLGQSKYIKMR